MKAPCVRAEPFCGDGLVDEALRSCLTWGEELAAPDSVSRRAASIRVAGLGSNGLVLTGQSSTPRSGRGESP